jgi:hypothetical protein
LYNHKKPTGDPTCPVYVRHAKRIFDRIKEAMELSDGEGGGKEDAEEYEEEDDDEPSVAVPHIPPVGELDVHPVVQREDGSLANIGNNGGASVLGSGPVRRSASVVGTPLVGTRIHTHCQAQGIGMAGNLSEVMQFTIMRGEAENQAEQ